MLKNCENVSKSKFLMFRKHLFLKSSFKIFSIFPRSLYLKYSVFVDIFVMFFTLLFHFLEFDIEFNISNSSEFQSTASASVPFEVPF